MFEKFCTVFLVTAVLILRKLLPDEPQRCETGYGNDILNIRPHTTKLSPSLQFILTLRSCMSKQKGPVCRERLVLLYLCMLLLQESYDPEPNPGPRPPKFPCGICNNAVKWTTPGVQCDSCKLWYHKNCMGMCDQVYISLRNVSWECLKCGLPNFSTCLFDLTFFESNNSFEPLQPDSSSHSLDCDMSFSNPRATSSPNRCLTSTSSRLTSTSSIPSTTLTDDANLTHPSFSGSSDLTQHITISRNKRNDIPLKLLVLNCQSIVNKKSPFELMCETIGADIVISTESWLNKNHLNTEFFPDHYSVYRKDRSKGKGGGVFILVHKRLQSMEPPEITTDSDCEMLWTQITVQGTSSLYVGAFYRPPNADQPEYLANLENCLSRIPEGAHIWLGGDFNLGDINWLDSSVNPSAAKASLCKQLLDITNNKFLEQQVHSPTRITEKSSNILDLFFTNNSSLISSAEVIPGISDHEAVYVEASLRPLTDPPLKRKVNVYKKADQDKMKEGLLKLHSDMSCLRDSSTKTLWAKFRDTLTSLMEQYIPTKTLKEGNRKKPWIDRTVRAAIRKKNKLFSRMKRTKKDSDIAKYKQTKQYTQLLTSQAH